jgi:hypothetical protein
VCSVGVLWAKVSISKLRTGSLLVCTMDESKRVYDLSSSKGDKSVELRALLAAHPGVDVNLYRDKDGNRALHRAAELHNVACLRLLIDARADLEAKNVIPGETPLWAINCHVYGSIDCFEALIESKADVTSRSYGSTLLHHIACEGVPKCLEMLINAKADVNDQSVPGWTPLIEACQEHHLPCVQLLLDNKADLSLKYEGNDACFRAMYVNHERPGVPFALLSCNTNSSPELVNIDYVLQGDPAMVSAFIDEYKHVHAFIDECHTIAKHALSEDVAVDTRVGRGDYGLYHEPLERILEYLGLSMDKNQTVNTSIDGQHTTRALIPGHPTNANLWFKLYHRTRCTSCGARPARLKECTCDIARYCNKKCQRKHWLTHKPSHKKVLEEKVSM